MRQQEVMNWLKKAVLLHQTGRLADAATFYEQVLRKVPANFDATRLLGVVRMQQGASKDAIALLEKARAMKPRSGEVLGHLGLAYKNAGAFDKAESTYKNALKLNPKDLNTILNLGNLFMVQGQAVKALPLYQRATVLQGNNPQCHIALGDALSDLGETTDAIDAYTKAHEVSPKSVDALNGIGRCLTTAGDLHKAVEAFQKALSIQPNNAHLHNNLGQTLQRQHRYDDAAAHFRKAIRFAPNLAPAHNNLGGALFETGVREEAVAAYDAALKLEPEFTAAWMNRAIALYNMQSPEDSIDSLQSAQGGDASNEVARAYEDILRHQIDASSPLPSPGDTTHDEASAIRDSYHYIATHGPTALCLSRQRDIHQLAMDATIDEGLILEFGVFFGHSIRFLASLTESKVHGFDSFEGIPEAWFKGEEAGAYSTAGNLPPVPENVELHVGWFNETLPGFTKNHSGPIRLVNIDCDIYSSTKCIFDELGSRIVPGTIIVFDEYICYPGWRQHEYKAFQEFVTARKATYEYLAYSLFSRQTVVRISTLDPMD